MIDIDFLMFLTLMYVMSSFNSTGKSVQTTTVHPLDIASSINLWPSRIFPLTAKKRLFFLISSEFSEIPEIVLSKFPWDNSIFMFFKIDFNFFIIF